MIDKSRALSLLGAGIGPVEVAATLGCDHSYISQLLMDESFRGQVMAKRLENLQATAVRDKKIDELEDEILDRLKNSVTFMHKSSELVAAFRILNLAKRRSAIAGAQVNIQQNIVQLQLPPSARRIFTVSHEGEVVEVDNKSTVTMPLSSLLQGRAKRIKGELSGQTEGTVLTTPPGETSGGRD